MAALSAVAAGEGPQADAVPADAAAFAAAAVVDENGYVICPLPPWDALPSVGRITSWPDHVPLERRNLSCKCFAHVGCSSPVRKRCDVPDNWFLLWLFSGTCEPGCVRGRSEQLAKEHKKAFAVVVGGKRDAAAAAAASAAASAAGSRAAAAAG